MSATLAPWKPLGAALMAYHHGDRDAALQIESDIFETEVIPARNYYRPMEDPLPELEKRALRHCRAQVLDLGAGAGRHSLELQKMGLTPLAVDISLEAVEIMKARGVRQTACLDFRDSLAGKFDTILMMMNGIGLAGHNQNLQPTLQGLRRHLRAGGIILCDGAELIQDMEGEQLAEIEAEAHGRPDLGETWFRLTFGSLRGRWYPWLFPSVKQLETAATQAQLSFEVLGRGARGAYLARLT